MRPRFNSIVSIDSQPRVLVTGGAGYIGSHTTLKLLEVGYKVVIVDNLCNSYRESVDRVRFLAGNCNHDDIVFVKALVNDKYALEKIFKRYNIVSVIHFAGLKSVSESLSDPLTYYRNNVTATCVLLECMKLYGCNKIVFSSSATVYGNTKDPYIKEDAPTSPSTPYGRSKLMCEEIIIDECSGAENDLQAIILRYFNPVGCHESGLIGENPKNAPNNLMPCVTNAMMSKTPMRLFGDDYSTADGTAVRDFIHVCDLADGHVAAVKRLEFTDNEVKKIEDERSNNYCEIFNMGNGVGSTVKEVIKTMEVITGVDVPYDIVARRPGDAECVVADPSKAFSELNWEPKKCLEDMCSTAWNWKSKNPDGYVSSVENGTLAKKALFNRLRKIAALKGLVIRSKETL